MSYHADLGTACPMGYGPDIRAIGWLSHDHPYPQGTVSTEFLAQLRSHVQDPWQPFLALGGHFCELCATNPFVSGANLWIPGRQVIYIAPAMIAHYIEAHEYTPPDEFIDAVMHCPPQKSAPFMDLMKPYLHYWVRKS